MIGPMAVLAPTRAARRSEPIMIERGAAVLIESERERKQIQALRTVFNTYCSKGQRESSRVLSLEALTGAA